MASINLTSPGKEDPTQSNPQLVVYFSNRGLMWRNLLLIAMLNIGWQLVFTVINPLMQLHLKNGSSGNRVGTFWH